MPIAASTNFSPVPEHSGIFVSTSGEVLSLTKDRLVVRKQTLDKSTGYYVVNRNGKKLYVHQLVALAFLEKSPGYVVNHKDSDKLNNLLTNLEWVSYSGNNKHSYYEGNKKKLLRPVVAVKETTSMYFASMSLAARAGFNLGNLQRSIRQGIRHKGYNWYNYEEVMSGV